MERGILFNKTSKPPLEFSKTFTFDLCYSKFWDETDSDCYKQPEVSPQ